MASTIGKLVPLIVAVIIVSAIGWVLYQVYDSATKFRDSASERMGKKNVVFTKDGVRVGVRHVQNENYVDKTQSWVVKAWNLGQPKPDADLRDYVLLDQQSVLEHFLMSRKGTRMVLNLDNESFGGEECRRSSGKAND
ncbi:hypothetical protein UVI_02021040 [Ustilaginoidea virens]|uniref:Uncharacterized protein n=1 Tax=Ustilaginoidea virens TaxID=1159556 RepID=A0A1B5KXP9_USTVR|nr:hypothetical protein UVI_02021040 [Ustilaginoidea virens]